MTGWHPKATADTVRVLRKKRRLVEEGWGERKLSSIFAQAFDDEGLRFYENWFLKGSMLFEEAFTASTNIKVTDGAQILKWAEAEERTVGEVLAIFDDAIQRAEAEVNDG